ncbi:MAG TPA: serine hydrolase domain-containing protein [Mycobacteriales bacterium]|jgi:CubicO group peptidase (beta-lactamase class C family)
MQELTRRRLLSFTARAQADGRLPSLATGVVRDGALVWSAVRGRFGDGSGDQPTTGTQYRIGSITKTFTAVQVMQLRDAGELALDTRVDDLVAGTPVGDRTVGQLLAHAGGLRAETAGDWWERSPGQDWPELLEPLDEADVPHPPGARFHYSNLGYAVLGEIVARRRGLPWEEALRRDVLGPLGLRRTTGQAQAPSAPGLAVHPWAPLVQPEPVHDYRAMAPAGQLWSTVEDLAVWAGFLLGDTGDVLSPDTLAEMADPGQLVVLDPVPTGYGLGLQVLDTGGARLVGHGGSVPGFLAGLFVDPAEGTGVVALANGTSGMPGDLAVRMLAALRELEPHVVGTWLPEPLPDGVGPDALGVWYWGPAAYALRAETGGLLHLGPLGDRGRTSRFRRRVDSTWLGLDGYYAGEHLTVARDAEGRATHLDVGSFTFTREPYGPGSPPAAQGDPAGWR